VYFSDSAYTYGFNESLRGGLQTNPEGRLFKLDMKTRKAELLLGGLYFANGVSLSQDESYILVAETAIARIQRYWLKGSVLFF
jgi:sugar lactone lactonase YvrE